MTDVKTFGEGTFAKKWDRMKVEWPLDDQFYAGVVHYGK